MTKPNLTKEEIEEFDNTKFAKGGGTCFECCDYEGMYIDLKDFLSRKKSEWQKEMYDKGAAEATMVCNDKTIPFYKADLHKQLMEKVQQIAVYRDMSVPLPLVHKAIKEIFEN